MRKWFILFFVLFCGNIFAQPTHGVVTADTINRVDSAGKRQGWWIIIGSMRPNLPGYSLDKKIEEGRYVNSAKVGMWISYYPDGKKKSEMNYVNNRPNGHAVMYNDDATNSISEEGTWVGVRWTGNYKLFYPPPGNSIRMEYCYNKNGMKDSVQTIYHPNGKVAIRISMKDGAECGYKFEYDTSGRLFRQTYYNCADGNSRVDTTKTRIFPPIPPNPPLFVGSPQRSGYDGVPNMNGKVAIEADMKKDSANQLSVSNAIDSAFQSLHCSCEADASHLPKGTFTGEGYWILYQNGQITMKGCFHLKRLVCGIQNVYDKNGMLIQIKKYKDGKYVGDAPLPPDANK